MEWISVLYGFKATVHFPLFTATEGVKDWSEPTHQMYTPDCKLPPQMPIYMMPGKELFSFHKMEWNLTRNQGVCSIREGYVHKVRDTSLAGVCHKMALAMQEVLHQQADVRGPRVRYVHQDQPSVKGYDVVL